MGLFSRPTAGKREDLPSRAIELPVGLVIPGVPPDIGQMSKGIEALIPRLKQGEIFCQAASVERNGEVVDLPENVLVAFIPASASRVIKVLSNIDIWDQFHSYFSYSHAEPGSTPDSVIQRFRLELPPSNPLLKLIGRLRRIDSQVLVTMEFDGPNWQAIGHLYQADQIQLASGHSALEIDDLSWTVYEVPGGVVLIYQILTRPKIMGVSAAVKKITEETVRNANLDIVRSVANRSIDETWTRKIDEKIQGDPAEQILGHPYRTFL